MIIFDLDQTLVDTSTTEALRTARRWGDVNRRLSGLSPYPGITELITELSRLGQELAIVTNSPDMVPRHFIRRCSWPIKIILGFHQIPSGKRKPDPTGLLMALAEGESAHESTNFHVGDAPEDTEASRRANMVSIGAGWGSKNVTLLRKSGPDHLFMSVDELHSFFSGLFGFD